MSNFIENFMANKKEKNYQDVLDMNRIRFAKQIEQSKGIQTFRNIFVGFCLILPILVTLAINFEIIPSLSIYDFVFSKEHFTWTGFILANFMHFHFLHIFMNLTAAMYLFNRFYFSNMKTLVVLVIVSGLMSSFASLAFAPDKSVTIGASGILFGVLTFLMMYVFDIMNKYKNEFDIAKLKKFLLIQLFFCGIINFIPMVAWYAHLGGAVAGFIMYLFVRKNLDFSYESFVLTYYKV